MKNKKNENQKINGSEKICASFRDPSGFVFRKNGTLYRQINNVYAQTYDLLMRSGLYAELATKGFLVKHEEVSGAFHAAGGYKIIQPDLIPFISYPYEWCFSELKDAALLTLKIQKVALRHGMTLKDASAYNIQFKNGRPILIDTLSFDKYIEGSTWVAYRQFCQHFLAPLALMSFLDVRLGQLSRIYIDGIPLDLASRLLPRRSWFNAAAFFHVHMHAKSQKRFSGKKVDISRGPVSRAALDNLVDNLANSVTGLKWIPKGTTWADYYENTNYSFSASDEKARIVRNFIDSVHPKLVWDLGANEGLYSRLASGDGIETIAFDMDESSVERDYLAAKANKENHLLPLLADLTNPSAALGWANRERFSLEERGPADLVLALALIHHLAITNNVPFPMAAEFFASISKMLIIEFVPKNDSQVERLLKNRADIFNFYNREEFEKEFSRFFRIVKAVNIAGSVRIIYLMEKR